MRKPTPAEETPKETAVIEAYHTFTAMVAQDPQSQELARTLQDIRRFFPDPPLPTFIMTTNGAG